MMNTEINSDLSTTTNTNTNANTGITTDRLDSHSWEPSGGIPPFSTCATAKKELEQVVPPLLGTNLKPAFDKIDAQQQNSPETSSLEDEKEDPRDQRRREPPILTLGADHGMVHEGVRWEKFPPLPLEFPPVLRPLGGEVLYEPLPELLYYPIRHDGLLSPPFSRAQLPPEAPVFPPGAKFNRRRNCCVAQPELIKRRSRAVLGHEYLTEHLPNDDGVFETIVRQYLLPFCSFNYLNMAYFEVQQQLGRIDVSEIFEINHRSSIPECREDDPGRFNVIMPRNMNFYEPKVFWCQPDSEDKRRGRNGLCPYCKPNPDDRRLDLSQMFFNMNTSAYLHHVTKQHGVYSNGTEMPLPAAIGSVLETKDMKSGRKCLLVDAVTCPVCHQMIKIQKLSDPSLVGRNRFLAYFRHMLTHNMKKKNGVWY